MALIKIWFSISFLMAKPSDLPGGQTALRISVAAAFVTYLIASAVVTDRQALLAPAVFDLAVAAICGYVALNLYGKPERFNQAFSAYCGVGVVLNLASLLILGPADGAVAADAGSTLETIAQFGYLVWGITAFAHILRFTFDVSIAVSVGISTGFLLLNIIVAEWIFPV